MNLLLALLFGARLGDLLSHLIFLAKVEYPRTEKVTRPVEVIRLVIDLGMLAWIGWYLFRLGGAS